MLRFTPLQYIMILMTLLMPVTGLFAAEDKLQSLGEDAQLQSGQKSQAQTMRPEAPARTAPGERIRRPERPAAPMQTMRPEAPTRAAPGERIRRPARPEMPMQQQGQQQLPAVQQEGEQQLPAVQRPAKPADGFVPHEPAPSQ